MSDYRMPRAWARSILEAVASAFSEGQIGDDIAPVVAWIQENYPDLCEEYRYLPWVKS